MKTRISLACTVLLSCTWVAVVAGPVGGQPIPPKIERFLELSERSRRGSILQLEHTLRGLRNQAPPTRETSLRIAQLEEQLRVLRSAAQPVVPPLAFPPQVGAIGRLPGLSCHVDQVVSNDTLLVRCYFPVVVPVVKNFTPRRESVVQSARFLIRGLATGDTREGSDVEMLQVFEITEKTRYTTTGGTSQEVPVLREFDMKAVEPYFRSMIDKR
jgi:hypothetical protein